MLVKAYSDYALGKSNGLKDFKVTILTWKKKNLEGRRKSLEAMNCKRMMRKTLKPNNY